MSPTCSSIPASGIRPVTLSATAAATLVASPLTRAATAIRRNPTIFVGAMLLAVLIAIAIMGPWFVADPFRQAPINRLRPPSERFWFGTDQFGREVFSRTIHGARVSLVVGISVALVSSALGLALGLMCGYFRRIDGVVMRVMDGLMAIPSILL